MARRTKSGRIVHETRPFSPGRPDHITLRVADGLPSLRRPEVFGILREAEEKAEKHGMVFFLSTAMKDHIHVFCNAASRKQRGDAMRAFVGHLARKLGVLFGVEGKVFPDRYWNTVCKSVNQLWATVGYILRNPYKACVMKRRPDGFDRFSSVDPDALATDGFARRCFGAPRRLLLRWLRLMVVEKVPFEPLVDRLQPALPGL